MIEAELHFVDDLETLEACRRWVSERRDRVAYDVETSGTNLGRDTVRLGQVGDRSTGWAFPCDGPMSMYGAYREVMANVVREARRAGYGVYAHNAIFDSSFSKRDDWAIPQDVAEDTMVMAQLSDSRYGIGLKPMAARRVDKDAVAMQRVMDAGMKAQGWTWATVPTDWQPYWAYGAMDPVLTCRIAEKLEPEVFPEWRENYEIEMAAIHVLRDAQLAGMMIDVPYARRMSDELGDEMDALLPTLPCLPTSDKQVVEFLQSQGCELFKKTEKGNWSTDDDVLKYFQDKLPILGPMRRYRTCQKLKSSYFDNLLEAEVDGVVRPSIRVLGAQKTGRMSITEPALQTLPKSSIGRNAFVARPGHTLVMADFSGIEMRLLAHAADETNMKAAYASGEDLHWWTAHRIAEFFGIEANAKLRGRAKGAGFGKVYGAGEETFASQAGLPLEQAKQFLAAYDRLFPGVSAYQEAVIRHVKEGPGRKWGQVRTLYGRRLYVPKDKAYKGINYTIQGTAGEVLKEKLAHYDAAGLTEYVRLPIHDEVVGEVPDEMLEEYETEVRRVMPERHRFSVPLEVDVEDAKRWGDAYLEDGEEPMGAPTHGAWA